MLVTSPLSFGHLLTSASVCHKASAHLKFAMALFSYERFSAEIFSNFSSLQSSSYWLEFHGMWNRNPITFSGFFPLCQSRALW